MYISQRFKEMALSPYKWSRCSILRAALILGIFYNAPYLIFRAGYCFVLGFNKRNELKHLY